MNSIHINLRNFFKKTSITSCCRTWTPPIHLASNRFNGQIYNLTINSYNPQTIISILRGFVSLSFLRLLFLLINIVPTVLTIIMLL